MKITPPAPQHPMRRLKFFMEHPDWPGARGWIDRLNAQMILSKRVKKELKVVVNDSRSQLDRLADDHKPAVKQTMKNKIASFFRRRAS